MNKRKGFTLVEILVSTIILALVAGGFFSIFVSARYLVTRSKRRHVAMDLARRELEDLRSEVAANWDDVGHALNPTPAGWKGWVSETIDGKQFQHRYRVDPLTAPSRVRSVTVQVQWNVDSI